MNKQAIKANTLVALFAPIMAELSKDDVRVFDMKRSLLSIRINECEDCGRLLKSSSLNPLTELEDIINNEDAFCDFDFCVEVAVSVSGDTIWFIKTELEE